MLVNKTLAQPSDWSYFTVFTFYLVAFVVSIAYYSHRIAAAEAKSRVAGHELVAAGAGDGVAIASVANSVESETKAPASVVKNQALAQGLNAVAEMLIYIGVTVHSTSVLLRGLAVQRFPWGNLYKCISVSILFVMVVGAGALHRETMRVFWPWTLAPVLALMFYGSKKLYIEAAPAVPALQSTWFPIHIPIIFIGRSITLISGMASTLYMLRMYNRRGSEKGFLGKLVSPLLDVQKLDMVAYRTVVWSFPLFSSGTVLGAIRVELARGHFWGWDPKKTTALITWIIYALCLRARVTSGWRNIKAMRINIFGFATMMLSLFFIGMMVSGLHSYAGLN